MYYIISDTKGMLKTLFLLFYFLYVVTIDSHVYRIQLSVEYSENKNQLFCLRLKFTYNSCKNSCKYYTRNL